ncbi:unnamed protein product [Schistosoma turkestanicum]|nr:unnamed protein product [Schistosoma turkestanicum]
MVDEATVYYNDAIDQLTLGRDLFFGECGYPLVALQIDPFGYARDHSDLYQDAGFDAVYIQRTDFPEKEKRKQMKEIEIQWSTTCNEKSSNVYEKTITNSKLYGLFAAMFYDTYFYSPTFEFDSKFPFNTIEENPLIQEYNADIIVKNSKHIFTIFRNLSRQTI